MQSFAWLPLMAEEAKKNQRFYNNNLRVPGVRRRRCHIEPAHPTPYHGKFRPIYIYIYIERMIDRYIVAPLSIENPSRHVRRYNK